MQLSFVDRSLHYYNDQIKGTFNSLPQQGVAWEVVRRIIVVVAAPLAYLAIGFGKIGQIFWNLVFENKRVTKTEDSENENGRIKSFKKSISDKMHSTIKTSSFIGKIDILNGFMCIITTGSNTAKTKMAFPAIKISESVDIERVVKEIVSKCIIDQSDNNCFITIDIFIQTTDKHFYRCFIDNEIICLNSDNMDKFLYSSLAHLKNESNVRKILKNNPQFFPAGFQLSEEGNLI